MNHLPEMQRKMKWFYLQMPQSPSVMTMFISSFLCIIASVLIQAGGYISTAFHSLVWWFKLQTPTCHHLKKIKILPVKNLIQSHHQSNAPSQEFIKSLLFFINLKKTDCSSFHHTHRERECTIPSKSDYEPAQKFHVRSSKSLVLELMQNTKTDSLNSNSYVQECSPESPHAQLNWVPLWHSLFCSSSCSTSLSFSTGTQISGWLTIIFEFNRRM